MALCHGVTQQALRCHDDQGLAERSQHLPTQHMEIVGRRSDVADLNIVIRTQLKEAFEPSGTVFRALAFIPMREQHHEAIGPQPFRFA